MAGADVLLHTCLAVIVLFYFHATGQEISWAAVLCTFLLGPVAVAVWLVIAAGRGAVAFGSLCWQWGGTIGLTAAAVLAVEGGRRLRQRRVLVATRRQARQAAQDA
eukprot:SAG11_NODE_17620_length_513_cov_1.185990_1_plen_105_part_01